MSVLNLIIHHKLNTSYNRAQYKFPVPVQLMEVLLQRRAVDLATSFKVFMGIAAHTSHDLTVMRIATSVQKTPYYIL